MHKIRILLADDHGLFRAGLRKLLEGIEDLEVVAEAKDGEEAFRLTCSLHPDVVLMDISMPGGGGMEATRRIKGQLPDVRILVLTAYANEEYVHQLLRMGSSGYVLKDIAPDEIVRAIRTVHGGEVYLGSAVSRMVVHEYLKGARGADTDPGALRLTPREREVFALVTDHLGNKEIADRLCISPRTVENHKQHIAQKLDLSSAKELAGHVWRERSERNA